MKMLADKTRISNFIEGQFPAFYHEAGPELVAFIKAYYEFLETHEKYSTYMSRRMFTAGDIDTTMEEFIESFKNKYLKDFPLVASTDRRFLVKHIMDVYRAKGTPQALQLLFQLLFGTTVDVHLPSESIWKLSASKWTQPFYLEMTVTPRNLEMLHKQIYGATSGATAFVESIVRKRVEGKIIDIVYISHIKGNFASGELVSPDGVLNNAPQVIGSLSSVDVTLGGANFRVGDILEVYSTHGKQGIVRVSQIENATGRVNFELIDGGYGYTLTRLSSGDLYNYRSDVYVSSAMLYIDNPGLIFERFEKVEQRRQIVDMVSALDISTHDWEPGQILNGYAVVDGVRELTATAVVGNITNYDDAGDPVETPQANISVELFPTLGRFDKLSVLSVGANLTGVAVGDMVNEESYYRLDFAVANPNFIVGDRVAQPVYDIVGGVQVLKSVATGIISVVSGASIDISPAFGNFVPLTNIVNLRNNQSALIVNVNELITGAKGRIQRVISPTSFVVSEVVGVFNIGNDVVRAKNPYLARAITNSTDGGVSDVAVASNLTKTGIVSSVVDQSVNGIIVGQNSTAVGVWGNAAPFSAIATAPIQLFVNADNMASASWAKTGSITVESTVEGDNIIQSTEVGVRTLNQSVMLNANEPYKVTFRVASPNSTAERVILSISHGAQTENVIVDLGNDSFIIDNQISVSQITVDRVAGSIWLDVSVWLTPISTAARIFRIALQIDSFINPANARLVVSRLLLNSELNLKRSWIITTSRPEEEGQVIGYINRIGTGQGANFEIGSLENEESITVNTDMLGDYNVTGEVTYPEIGLGGWNSGVAMVGGFVVVDGGTGYANGTSVHTSPSGIAMPATGTIQTNGAGTIVSIALADSGHGFDTNPEVVLPATTGDPAIVTVNTLFGYGFPANPMGGINTIIADCLTIDSLTIGTISALSRINPGANYNAPPFVEVRNKWIAGFGRRDFILRLTSVSGVFREGELVVQQIPDPSNPGGLIMARGIVKHFTGSDLYVKRASFSVSLTHGVPVTGYESGANGMVNVIDEDGDSHAIGENAIINSKVQTANGTVTQVEVIDSGYGYEEGELVGLRSNSNITIVEGISRLGKQGRGTGFWETTTSHISHDKVLQDSYFYQDFSYQLESEFSVDKYQDLVEKITHIAGHKMFGAVVISREIDMPIGYVESETDSVDFNPQFLFYREEYGALYDISDRATLFQNAAGTVPVTAAGQRVGLVLDKSGNGLNLTQTTASQRPEYRIDSGGRPYLYANGTNGIMLSVAKPISGTITVSWAGRSAGGALQVFDETMDHAYDPSAPLSNTFVETSFYAGLMTFSSITPKDKSRCLAWLGRVIA